MRTTLKSRLGRAHENGSANGSGNGLGTLPPEPLPPVTIYKQPPPPPRPRTRLALRMLGWLGIAVVMIVAGTGGGYYLWLHESTHEAAKIKTPGVKKASKQLKVPVAGQPTTALVIGYDHRANEGKGTPSRSDTLMLIRADPRNDTISLLSIPRDLQADIRCPGKTSYVAKINSAYTECGAQGALSTVRGVTNLDINYLITVDFHGFKEIVDRLGGIYLDVDRRYLNTHGGPYGYATINLQPGYQLLSGQSALDFVRFRHTDSDLYRVARQQLFVKALKDRARSKISPTSPSDIFLQLPKLVNAITHNTEVAQGGGKEVSFKTILSYALFAFGLKPGHVFQVKIEGLEGYADLTTSQQNVTTAVQEFLHPDVDSSDKATDVALGVRPKVKAPPASQTTVTVLNGNGVPGSATQAGSLLSQRGYQLLTPPNGILANAPTFKYFRSRIYYDPRQRGAKPAAAKLAGLIGSADVSRLTRPLRALGNGAMVVSVVGQTFHGSLAPAPIDKTPKRQPANVAPGTSAALDLLRARQRKVPFRLMVPTVIEQSSWVDREKPIRLYRIDGDHGKHKAIRLVYRLGGANRYWGVEETDWTDAPILADKSLARRIKGHAYTLYYNGPHLHMVVIKRSQATYWVVNTLLDELSNETMLAIAKGLRPIDQVH
jgi:LCP family protein required for cell wall assembly